MQHEHMVNNMVFELFCQLLITSSITQEMLILLVMLLCQLLSCLLKYAILIYKLTKYSLFYRHSAVWPTVTLCQTPQNSKAARWMVVRDVLMSKVPFLGPLKEVCWFRPVQ